MHMLANNQWRDVWVWPLNFIIRPLPSPCLLLYLHLSQSGWHILVQIFRPEQGFLWCYSFTALKLSVRSDPERKAWAISWVLQCSRYWLPNSLREYESSTNSNVREWGEQPEWDSVPDQDMCMWLHVLVRCPNCVIYSGRLYSQWSLQLTTE